MSRDSNEIRFLYDCICENCGNESAVYMHNELCKYCDKDKKNEEEIFFTYSIYTQAVEWCDENGWLVTDYINTGKDIILGVEDDEESVITGLWDILTGQGIIEDNVSYDIEDTGDVIYVTRTVDGKPILMLELE